MASGSDAKERVILGLGGAFNPVHTRHILAMETGKRWLETNMNYEVVAGRLAVSPDGYVKSKVNKTGERCMKAEHRIQLCKLACDRHKEWLAPFAKPVGSAKECVEKTRSEMLKSKSDKNIHVAIIIGADRAMNKTGHAKWHKDPHITLCIGRKGETARISEQYKYDLEHGRVKHSQFYLVPEELDNISSTCIRKQLSELVDVDTQENNKNIIQDLVVKNWISKSQGQYILDNYSELYLS